MPLTVGTFWLADNDVMADSPTLRVQRHRRHAAGDHSIYRPGRCPAAGRVMVAEPSVEAVDGLDPAYELRASAVRLAAACRADPGNATLAKELRATLLVLPQPDPVNRLDVLRARAQWKRLGWLSGDGGLAGFTGSAE